MDQFGLVVFAVRSIMNTGKNDYKNPPVGLLPKDWDFVTIGDLINRGVIWIKNGYAQGNHNQKGLGIPHLRPFNISTVSTHTRAGVVEKVAQSGFELPGRH